MAAALQRQPVDLVQAASNPLKEVNKGGTTRFEEFSGLLSVDAAGYHFRKLKVSSGAMKAQGKLDIFPQQQLLDTDLKGTATLISRRSWFPAHCATRYCVPPARSWLVRKKWALHCWDGLGTALGIKASNMVTNCLGRRAKNQSRKKKLLLSKQLGIRLGSKVR